MLFQDRIVHIFIYFFLWFLLNSRISRSLESDVDCLRSLKASLKDPLNSLSPTWNFNNASAGQGFICSFSGIECWNPNENKVLNIKLSDMGLKGQFPRAIANCSSLTGLDLSHNNISGPIPSDISSIIAFVTRLDLSYNNFNGQIPENLANCSYLNEVRLDDNQLTGQIPPELGLLGRIKDFSVTNNQLTGPVPNFGNVSISADNYANNPGLCGKPLPPCLGPRKTRSGPIIGAAVAGVIVAVLGVSIGTFFALRKRASKKKKDDDPEGNKWAKSIKGAKGVKISMFGKSVTKMRLNDLMKATNDFSKNNIIGSERTGTTYTAVLEDGTSLMVKRLQDIQHNEKEFAAEMATLGSVKHNNLVPLLGFCVAKKERFLVYKHMPNGTLHNKLHPQEESDKKLDWPFRLRIAIGAAKGFAWLHHSCNPRIIHRNISSKCILLDADFEPKISDFGLARLMNPIDTHLSTFVNGEFGEFGYVAPEYARTLVATPKGDVFSFGVLLLELVTGERPTNVTTAPESLKGNMVDWISHLSSNSRLQDAIDKSLVGKGYDNELYQSLKIACSCVLPPAKERPTMYEVYQLLRAIGLRYNFTTAYDDLLMLPETGDAGNGLVELIVAREAIEHAS